MKQNEIVIFDKVSLNDGNAYNVTSGIFIAPVDGIYSFSWTVLTKGGKSLVDQFHLIIPMEEDRLDTLCHLHILTLK